jgi:hypothetical protein
VTQWNDRPIPPPRKRKSTKPRRYVDPGTGPRKRPRQACMVVGPVVVAGPVTLMWLLWRRLR